MTHKLAFFVGKIDDGAFVAISPNVPYFCIERATKEAALQAALDAFEFYLSTSNGATGKPHVVSTEPYAPAERHFLPSEMVLAHAC